MSTNYSTSSQLRIRFYGGPHARKIRPLSHKNVHYSKNRKSGIKAKAITGKKAPNIGKREELFFRGDKGIRPSSAYGLQVWNILTMLQLRHEIMTKLSESSSQAIDNGKSDKDAASPKEKDGTDSKQSTLETLYRKYLEKKDYSQRRIVTTKSPPLPITDRVRFPREGNPNRPKSHIMSDQEKYLRRMLGPSDAKPSELEKTTQSYTESKPEEQTTLQARYGLNSPKSPTSDETYEHATVYDSGGEKSKAKPQNGDYIEKAPATHWKVATTVSPVHGGVEEWPRTGIYNDFI